MYTNVKYVTGIDGSNACIYAEMGGVTLLIPLVQGNSDYDEIMRQVNAGTLTIQDAS
jgi:hypothetical protein